MPSRPVPSAMWQGFQVGQASEQSSGLLDDLRKSYDDAMAPVQQAASSAWDSLPTLPSLDEITASITGRPSQPAESTPSYGQMPSAPSTPTAPSAGQTPSYGWLPSLDDVVKSITSPFTSNQQATPQPFTGSPVGMPQGQGAPQSGVVARAGTRASRYGDAVERIAQEEGVPADALAALIDTEDSGENSVSPAGAKGLMQVVPGQGYDLPGEDAFDPLVSIRQGARALRDKYRATGSWDEAGAAYFGYGTDAGGMTTNAYRDRYLANRSRYAGNNASSPQPPSLDAGGERPAQAVAASAGEFARNQGDVGRDLGLSWERTLEICGPVAAAAFLRATGRTPGQEEAEAMRVAQQKGYWQPGRGMGGPESQSALLRDLGVANKLEWGVDWNKVRADVQRGNPVQIDTEGHYFVAQGYDPSSGMFNLGQTAAFLRASGGRTWFRPEEIANLGMGAPRAAIYLDNPETPAPSVVAGRSEPPQQRQAPPAPWQGVPQQASSGGDMMRAPLDTSPTPTRDNWYESGQPSQPTMLRASGEDQNLPPPPDDNWMLPRYYRPAGDPPNAEGANDHGMGRFWGDPLAPTLPNPSLSVPPDAMYRQPLGAASPVRDNWASDPAQSLPAPFMPGDGGYAPQSAGQQPYNPDEGPRESRSPFDLPVTPANDAPTGYAEGGVQSRSPYDIAPYSQIAPDSAPPQGPGLPTPTTIAPSGPMPIPQPTAAQALRTGASAPFEPPLLQPAAEGIKQGVSWLWENVLKPANDTLNAANEWVINNPVLGQLNPQAMGRELQGWDQIAAEMKDDTERLDALVRRADAGDTSVVPEIQALQRSMSERMRAYQGREGRLAAGERNPNKAGETMGQIVQAAAATALAPSLGSGVVRNAAAAVLDPIGQATGGVLEAGGRALEAAPGVVRNLGEAASTAWERGRTVAREANAADAMAPGGMRTGMSLGELPSAPVTSLADGVPAARSAVADATEQIPPSAAPSIPTPRSVRRPVEVPPRYPEGTPEAQINTVIRQSAATSPDGLAHLTGAEIEAMPGSPFRTVGPDGKVPLGTVPIAPGGVPSMDDLRDAVEAGLPHKDFYEDIGRRARAVVGEENLPEFFTVAAITSQQTKVDDNVGAVLGIMRWMREQVNSGRPWEEIKADFLDMGEKVQKVSKKTGKPMFDKNGKPVEEYVRRPTVPFTLATGAKRRAIIEAYETGLTTVEGGAKTSSFAGNFESAGGAVFDHRTTNDMWAWRSFNVLPGKENVAGSNDAAYRMLETIYKELAAEQGLQGYQVQAAVWATIKNLGEQAPDLMAQFRSGEKTLGQIIEEGRARHIVTGGTKYPLFDIPTGQGGSFHMPPAQRALSGVDPGLMRQQGPREAANMTREYLGQGEIPLPSNRSTRLDQRVGPESQAATVAAPIPPERLAEMGIDPETNTFPWLSVPHRVAYTNGQAIVHLPGGNSLSAEHIASVVARETGEAPTIHIPRADANDVAGTAITADEGVIDSLSAILDDEGIPHVVGTTGRSIQIPFLDDETFETQAGIIQNAAARAGVEPDGFVFYNGEVRRNVPAAEARDLGPARDIYGSPGSRGVSGGSVVGDGISDGPTAATGAAAAGTGPTTAAGAGAAVAPRRGRWEGYHAARRSRVGLPGSTPPEGTTLGMSMGALPEATGGDWSSRIPSTLESPAQTVVRAINEATLVTPERMVALIGDRPEYLAKVAENILTQRKKVINGEMTAWDVAKAYYMTMASQGADAIKVSTVEAKVPGFKIPEEFWSAERAADGSPLIRPEEAAAAWLFTPNGQRAKARLLEDGVIDHDAWEEGIAVRRAFGDDRFRTNNVFSQRAPVNGRTQFNMDSIVPFTERFNEVGRTGDAQALLDLSKRLNGISEAKGPFLNHALGFGEKPTVDAVEISAWLTGQGDTSLLKGAAADLKRQIDRELKDKRVGQALGARVEQQFAAMKELLPPEMKAGLPDEVFNHVLHHWIWDRMKGTETTHKGFYNALMNAMSMGETPPSGGGDTLSRVNRVLGQGILSSVTGGTAAAANQQMNPDDPNAALKGFVVGAAAPPLINRGMRRLARAVDPGTGGVRALSALGDLPEYDPRLAREPVLPGLEPPRRLPGDAGPPIGEAASGPRSLEDVLANPERNVPLPGLPGPISRDAGPAVSEAASGPRSLEDVLTNPERNVPLPGMTPPRPRYQGDSGPSVFEGRTRDPMLGDVPPSQVRQPMLPGTEPPPLPPLEKVARDLTGGVADEPVPTTIGKDGQISLDALKVNANLGQRFSEALASAGEVLKPWSERANIVRYGSMLSDTASHAFNISSNLLLQLRDAAGTPLAVGADVLRARATGTPREVFMAELPARLAGMRAGYAVGMEAAADILKGGGRVEGAVEGGRVVSRAAGKLDEPVAGFGTNIPFVAPSGTRRAAVVDAAFEMPLRALSAADAVFRMSAQSGHLAAEATAKAMKKNKGRAVTGEMVREAMKDVDLLDRVNELSARSVLQEDRYVTKWWGDLVAKAPEPLRTGLRLEIPFTRTPYNVVAQGVGMTPLGLLGLVQDIKQGRAPREMAQRVANVAMGTAVMGAAFQQYTAGNLTGAYPTNEKERSTLPPGWRPYSYKVGAGGETYYVPLAGLGPLALPAVAAILMAEGREKSKSGELDGAWAAQVALGVGQYASQQTFFEGVNAMGKLVDARTGDPWGNVNRHVNQIVGQFSPHVIGGGALGREIQRVLEMPSRDPKDALDSLLATIPYQDSIETALGRDSVPVRRDVLGREQSLGMGGPLAPVIRAGQENDSPVIAAYRNAGEGLPMAEPKTLSDPQTHATYPVPDYMQERWRVEFGQELEQRWLRAGMPSDSKRLRDVENGARSAVNARLVRDLRGGPVVPAGR